MKINEAAFPNPQTTPVQSSLLNYADTFHVSLHTTDHFCRVLDFFDLFVRRNTTPTWNINAERRIKHAEKLIKHEDARVHEGFRQLDSAA